jgi:YnbE-like lipoprotein
MKISPHLVMAMPLFLCSGCHPRIAIDAPKEPIMINMTVKIEHEIRIRVDKALDQLISSDPSLF